MRARSPSGASVVSVLVSTFRPRRITTIDAPLQITSDYAGQAPVALPFFAQAGAGALAYVDPLDLGAGPIGQPFTAPVTVQNTGTSCIDVYRPVSDLAPTIDIAATGPAMIELQAGESYTWTATCTPPSAGTTYATLTHETRAWDSSYRWQLVSCSDVAVLEAAVAPAAHDFGAVALPAAPVQAFELRNTGTRPLTVTGATLDPPGDFAIAGLPGGLALEPGAAHPFTVQATPAALGARRATLAIALDLVAPIAVPLDALATDPALVVTTPDAAPGDYAVDFGAVDVDTGPRLATVQLANTTAVPMAITACSIAGDPELSIATACPLAIPPGATADLVLAFAPTAEAESAALVSLAGTGFATGALALRVRGTGLDRHVGGGCAAGGGPVGGGALGAALLLALWRRRAAAPAARAR